MNLLWLVPATSHLSPYLYPILFIAAAGTALLFLMSIAVYLRRRTTPFLLISIAIGLLVLRSIIGFGTVRGVVPMNAHHMIEHGFDFLIAALILVAIYLSGSETVEAY